MASRLSSYCRSLVIQLGENKRPFATASIPKMKAASSSISSLSNTEKKLLDKVERKANLMRGDLAPIWIIAGMLMAAIGLAGHSAKQQLVHAPGVKIRKSKRESLPEVDDPDAVIGSANKFINKSFLRKVAHSQDSSKAVHDPFRPNPYTTSRKAETLKSVGVEPRRKN